MKRDAGIRRQAVVDYITRHGPSFYDDLMSALSIPQGSMAGALKESLAEGLLVIEKVNKPGVRNLMNCVRLSTQTPVTPEQVIVLEKAKQGNVPPLPRFDPADPFGLAKRMAAGEKVKLPEAIAMPDEPAGTGTEIVVDRASGPVDELVITTSAALKECSTRPASSAIVQRYQTETDDRDDNHDSDFVVALLSNSNLELRIDGKTVTLSKARWEYMREFVNKVEMA